MHSISCRRTGALYSAFQRHFGAVRVISTTNRHLLASDAQVAAAADIYDAPTRDYRTVIQGRTGKPASASEGLKQSWLGNLGLKLQASFPTLYWLGEGGRRYQRNAVNFGAQLVRSTGITHLFSSFPPYADHCIAYRLKRAFPHLVWIADFRDLHIDPTQNNLMFRRYQRRVNRRILHHADIVTTVSEGLAEHLRALHHNVFVVRNGLTLRPADAQPYKKFTIAYTGSMFQDKRRPEPLLQAIADGLQQGVLAREDLSVVYAGKDGEVWRDKMKQFGLEDLLQEKGVVAPEAAREIQQRAHLNLLLTYSTSSLKGNLTGKLYDYLEAGRPIIALINGPHDPELAAVVEGAQAGTIFDHTTPPEDLLRFIESLYTGWKRTGRVAWTGDRAFLASLQWEEIVDRFIEQAGVSQTWRAHV
ncbi:MAG: hypothetical protein R3301_04820 [Saprospiraceae bacterium]|nr:hypothetical protein [Saprospiraceae bacterium]